MNSEAVSQARSRLQKAEKALLAFRSATDIAEAEEAWTDFLLATATIYSKLEQGAKGYSKSVPWFGRKKKERRDDPLLRYLHFARNSDEHGIVRVAAVTDPNNDLAGRPLRFNERVPLQAQMMHRETNEPDGPVFDVVLAGPTLKPVRAGDSRFGDFCDPPKQHLGKEILYSQFVDHLAETSLPYFRRMIEEAGGLSNSIAR